MSANIHPTIQAALAPVTPPACAHPRTVPLIQNRARCLERGRRRLEPAAPITAPALAGVFLWGF